MDGLDPTPDLFQGQAGSFKESHLIGDILAEDDGPSLVTANPSAPGNTAWKTPSALFLMGSDMKNRPGSAPPTLLGPNEGFSFNAGNGSDPSQDLRSDPEYVRYYYANRLQNPRLPPPIWTPWNQMISQEISNEQAQTNSFSLGNGLLRPSSLIQPMAQKPTASRIVSQLQAFDTQGSAGDELNTSDSMGQNSSGNIASIQSLLNDSDEWNPLQPTQKAETGAPPRNKSVVDLIQADFPRTPSPVHQLAQMQNQAQRGKQPGQMMENPSDQALMYPQYIANPVYDALLPHDHTAELQSQMQNMRLNEQRNEPSLQPHPNARQHHKGPHNQSHYEPTKYQNIPEYQPRQNMGHHAQQHYAGPAPKQQDMGYTGAYNALPQPYHPQTSGPGGMHPMHQYQNPAMGGAPNMSQAPHHPAMGYPGVGPVAPYYGHMPGMGGYGPHVGHPMMPVNPMIPVGAVPMQTSMPQPYYPHPAAYDEYNQMYWDANSRGSDYQKGASGYGQGHPGNADSPTFTGSKVDERGAVAVGDRQKQAAGPYPNSSPSTLQNSIAGRPADRRQKTDGVQQVGGGNLLDEFRLNKTRKFELYDIVDNVVEFCEDQYGSRFIQQKLETASMEEKDMVFQRLLPSAIDLMKDVFGNYVIQKFFEHGTPEQKRALTNELKGQILGLSLQMYGCRVVQKAIESIEFPEQEELVRELDGNVLKCVKDQNGNHVIQKCIERIPPTNIQFIVDAFTGQVHVLATHPYGCRVIQRILEYCSQSQVEPIMQELLRCTASLVQDQYGNYVIQHILEHGKQEDRYKIFSKLKGQMVLMSQHKFARLSVTTFRVPSNVVEKCVQHGSNQDREDILIEVLAPSKSSDGSTALQIMMKDQFANYVVQKLLDVCEPQLRDNLINHIKPHIPLLKKVNYGKHILARLEKILGKGAVA